MSSQMKDIFLNKMIQQTDVALCSECHFKITVLTSAAGHDFLLVFSLWLTLPCSLCSETLTHFCSSSSSPENHRSDKQCGESAASVFFCDALHAFNIKSVTQRFSYQIHPCFPLLTSISLFIQSLPFPLPPHHSFFFFFSSSLTFLSDVSQSVLVVFCLQG